jgi:hypothetical protein
MVFNVVYIFRFFISLYIFFEELEGIEKGYWESEMAQWRKIIP